jgi:hypothetical protein
MPLVPVSGFSSPPDHMESELACANRYCAGYFLAGACNLARKVKRRSFFFPLQSNDDGYEATDRIPAAFGWQTPVRTAKSDYRKVEAGF